MIIPLSVGPTQPDIEFFFFQPTISGHKLDNNIVIFPFRINHQIERNHYLS